MKDKRTINVHPDCKAKLHKLKIHPREPYGDVIDKLIQEHDENIGIDPNVSIIPETPGVIKEVDKIIDNPTYEQAIATAHTKTESSNPEELVHKETKSETDKEPVPDVTAMSEEELRKYNNRLTN